MTKPATAPINVQTICGSCSGGTTPASIHSMCAVRVGHKALEWAMGTPAAAYKGEAVGRGAAVYQSAYFIWITNAR